jgi:predicted TIM-barrel fold metal-dependent hydrolase
LSTNIAEFGAIDCDIHPAVPNMRALLPYLDEYWRDAIVSRGIAGANQDLSSYPPNAPLSVRPDWKPEKGNAGTDIALLKTQALDAFGTRFAIANPLHGALVYANEYMAAALCSAVNDWMAKEWLDADPRLRASILVPAESPELAVAEIERLAHDRRFVQVLFLVMGGIPLGKRFYWPIYAAAEKHGMPIGVHAGSMYRNAPTSIGWGSFQLEDYVAQSQAFEGQLLSLVSEGVFVKFPALKVVMIESGFTWLPAYFWRADKTWRGVRSEVPWLDRPPSEVVREHVRFTIQPTDEPPDPAQLTRVLEQIGSDDVLLFSTDYPHWHYEGEDVIPAGIPPALLRKILVDNALATYPRLTN